MTTDRGSTCPDGAISRRRLLQAKQLLADLPRFADAAVAT